MVGPAPTGGTGLPCHGTGWWDKIQASKLAFSDTNRNRRLGLSPCVGVATGLFKTPRTRLKKQAKMTRHWNLS